MLLLQKELQQQSRKKFGIYCIILVLTALLPGCSSKTKTGTLKQTIGVASGNPRNYSIKYQVENIVYSERVRSFVTWLYNDECFDVLYDSAKPLDFEVQYWSPRFIVGEKTGKTIGVVTSIQPSDILSKYGALMFGFEVDGQSFERLQILPPKWESLYPELKIGQYYEVEYWKVNSQRAILNLNHQINP